MNRQAWKHSKKDFFVIFLTFVVTFIFDTGVGLSVGELFRSLPSSLVWYCRFLQNNFCMYRDLRVFRNCCFRVHFLSCTRPRCAIH